MLLAYSKIYSIADTISQDTQDGDISPIKFQKVLSLTKIISKTKLQPRLGRSQEKKKQLEELLEKGKKRQAQKVFYKKLLIVRVSRVSMPLLLNLSNTFFKVSLS